MNKRIFKFRKKQMMNEIFAQHVEGVLAERRLEDLKQTLFKIAYFEFEHFAFRPDMDFSEQVHRLEFISEILDKCSLKEEYFKYSDERKEREKYDKRTGN